VRIQARAENLSSEPCRNFGEIYSDIISLQFITEAFPPPFDTPLSVRADYSALFAEAGDATFSSRRVPRADVSERVLQRYGNEPLLPALFASARLQEPHSFQVGAQTNIARIDARRVPEELEFSCRCLAAGR
jgi:hypothetical protein